ncbi:MAG: tetratricopeptide repeat protein [Bacteroidales bacterium]|nr:tetratricopeptide repeat protein [Bacteroidales bacterium]
MAKDNKNDASQKQLQEAASKTEVFFEKNGKTLSWCAIALLAVAAVAFAWYRFIYQPKCAEAQAEMASIEQRFTAVADTADFSAVLYGDGEQYGFEQIISKYGSKAGKAVYLYAGICALNLGEYDQAVSYLKKYNGKEEIMASRALKLTGDAYVGLGKLEAALGCYEKAATACSNVYAADALLNAGVVCEELGKTDKALKYYKEIKESYPQSMEAVEIDKYISRIESK